jgi:ATP-dependent helicase/nuclease subunit A
LINTQSHIWVNASAGTGKTKLLVDRIVQLLLLGETKIICLTFTKAAALEMENRLNQKLAFYLNAPDHELLNEIEPHLIQKSRTLFAHHLNHPVTFQTLHSYAQKILSQFPIEAGIQTPIQIMTDGEKQKILKQSLDETLQILNPEIINSLSHRMDDHLLFKYLLDWSTHRSLFFNMINDDFESKFEKILIPPAPYTPVNINNLKTMGLLFKDKGSIVFQKRGEAMHRYLNDPHNNDSFNDFKSCFLTQKFEILKNLANKNVVDEYPQIQSIMNKEAVNLFTYFEHKHTYEWAMETHNFIQIIRDVLVNYDLIKQNKSLLDFQDLIEKTVQLLQNTDEFPWVAHRIHDSIHHLLIDEAQDTNPEQWTLIDLLCSSFFDPDRKFQKTLFVVGDPKQSIYGFQGSNADDFIKYHHYFNQKSIIANQPFNEIDLTISYRSTAQILNFVDDVFNDTLNTTHQSYRTQNNPNIIGNVAPIHDHDETLKINNEKKDGWKIIPDTQLDDTELNHYFEPILNHVQKLLSKTDPLPSTNKPIEPSDILLLIRKRSLWSQYLMDYFNAHNQPISFMDKKILNDNIAVLDLIAWGRFIAQPHDDYSLGCLLKSPYFTISENELFDLCRNDDRLNNKTSLWTLLQSHPSYASIYKKLNIIIETTLYYDLFEFFTFIMNQFQSIHNLLNHESSICIDMFLNYVREFQFKTNGSMDELLLDFDINKPRIQFPINPNAIQMMTIHGSKGLQSPIVIIVDMHMNPFGKHEPIIWDRTQNIMYLPPQNPITESKRLKEIQKETLKNEHNRLLYVALTRAQDNLYIYTPKSFDQNSLLVSMLPHLNSN